LLLLLRDSSVIDVILLLLLRRREAELIEGIHDNLTTLIIFPYDDTGWVFDGCGDDTLTPTIKQTR
jgi:hypothetical protein